MPGSGNPDTVPGGVPTSASYAHTRKRSGQNDLRRQRPCAHAPMHSCMPPYQPSRQPMNCLSWPLRALESISTGSSQFNISTTRPPCSRIPEVHASAALSPGASYLQQTTPSSWKSDQHMREKETPIALWTKMADVCRAEVFVTRSPRWSPSARNDEECCGCCSTAVAAAVAVVSPAQGRCATAYVGCIRFSAHQRTLNLFQPQPLAKTPMAGRRKIPAAVGVYVSFSGPFDSVIVFCLDV